MATYTDSASFYGFPVYLPVRFGPQREVTRRFTLSGKPLFIRTPDRGRILEATVVLTAEELASMRGDGSMDFATRLEWVAGQPGAVSMTMIQNVPQDDNFNSAPSVSANAAKGATTVNIGASGSNLVSVGRHISFSGHSSVYRVTLSRTTRLDIQPALREDVSAAETVSLTPTFAFVMVSAPDVQVDARRFVRKQLLLQEAF